MYGVTTTLPGYLGMLAFLECSAWWEDKISSHTQYKIENNNKKYEKCGAKLCAYCKFPFPIYNCFNVTIYLTGSIMCENGLRLNIGTE